MLDGYEKQVKLTPRKLLDTIDTGSVNSNEKQKEIDQLKDQLKKMDEQLIVTQK